MRMRRMVAVTLAASVILVTGCSGQDPVPTKPTAIEIRQFTERVSMIERTNDELISDESAAVPTVDLPPRAVENPRSLKPFSLTLSGIKNVARQMQFEDCMVASGYSVGAEYLNIAPTRNASDFLFALAEGGTAMQCHQAAGNFESPPDPYSGLLGAKQRAYVYEYYVQWLVPCLANRGQFLQSAPTKNQFTNRWKSSGWWTPYEALRARLSSAELVKLERDCPPMPAGFD